MQAFADLLFERRAVQDGGDHIYVREVKVDEMPEQVVCGKLKR